MLGKRQPGGDTSPGAEDQKPLKHPKLPPTTQSPSTDDTLGTDDNLVAKLKGLKSLFEKHKVDGYTTSRVYRKALKQKEQFEKLENLTYGEINLGAFAELLKWIKEHCASETVEEDASSKEKLGWPRTFCDVGAGTGKAILVAPLVFSSLKQSIGFEIVPSLCESFGALKLDYLKACLPSSGSSLRLELVEGDSFVTSAVEQWEAADLLFISTTCFNEDLFSRVKQSLLQLREGAVFITTTRKLTNQELLRTSLSLLHERRCRYGKGTLLFLVYKKGLSMSCKP